MKRTAIIISVISTILFTDLLLCCGAFGETVGDVALGISLTVLKWAAIAIGYILCMVVPFRILFLLNQRKEIKREINRDEELRRVTQQNNELIRKIEESYYNHSEKI